MLEPFIGELFVHPAALDFNGCGCSNGCAYCFAQSHKADRAASMKRLVDLCYGRSKHNSLTDWLFDNGYPVCFSNRTDPFAVQNEAATGVAFEAMNNACNPVYIQTKGGAGRDFRLMDRLSRKEVVVYVTVTSPRNSVLSRIESGAPRFEHRQSILTYARDRGWLPIVGLNPLWPDWWTDRELEDFACWCEAAGISHIIIQPLHLSRTMYANFPASSRARLTEAETSGAFRYGGEKWNWYVSRFAALRRHKGLRVFPVGGAPVPVDFYTNTPQLPKRLHGIQEFTDYALKERDGKGRHLFTFRDFAEVMTRGNPEMLSYAFRQAYQYLMLLNRSAWKKHGEVKAAKTFIDIFRAVWNLGEFYDSPQRRECFRVLVDDCGRPVLDYDGNIQIVCPPADWLHEMYNGGERFEKGLTVANLMGKGVKL